MTLLHADEVPLPLEVAGMADEQTPQQDVPPAEAQPAGDTPAGTDEQALPAQGAPATVTHSDPTTINPTGEPAQVEQHTEVTTDTTVTPEGDA